MQNLISVKYKKSEKYKKDFQYNYFIIFAFIYIL